MIRVLYLFIFRDFFSLNKVPLQIIIGVVFFMRNLYYFFARQSGSMQIRFSDETVKGLSTDLEIRGVENFVEKKNKCRAKGKDKKGRSAINR